MNNSVINEFNMLKLYKKDLLSMLKKHTKKYKTKEYKIEDQISLIFLSEDQKILIKDKENNHNALYKNFLIDSINDVNKKMNKLSRMK